MSGRKATSGAQLDLATLLTRARELTGHSDFGDPWFLQPLAGLIGLINREGALESADTRGVRVIVKCLADRLRLVDYLKRHPRVREEKVEVAGIIFAHGRGGSTLTQRLLISSTQLTSACWWELITPVPLHNERSGDFAARQQLGREWIDEFNRSFPEFARIHPMDPMDADEEVVLMDRSFLSMMYNCYFNLPGFPAWLMQQDHRQAYEELKLWLQLLQYQAPGRKGRKWLLKAVHHFLCNGLDVMLHTFPDAKAIITHRHLESVIASFCSSWAPFLRNYAPGVNPLEMGPRILAWYEAATAAMFEVRKAAPADRFIDIQYRDTVSDPLGQFRRTMQSMGLPVTTADEKLAAQWMAGHGRDSHPPHQYRLEDYGLSRDAVAQAFEHYHRTYLY